MPSHAFLCFLLAFFAVAGNLEQDFSFFALACCFLSNVGSCTAEVGCTTSIPYSKFRLYLWSFRIILRSLFSAPTLGRDNPI
jgi:hypothetical protein